MLRNQGVNHGPTGSESIQRAFFIRSHQTAVPLHVGAENRRQLALYAIFVAHRR
jgi:hypothetical protein